MPIFRQHIKTDVLTCYSSGIITEYEDDSFKGTEAIQRDTGSAVIGRLIDVLNRGNEQYSVNIPSQSKTGNQYRTNRPLSTIVSYTDADGNKYSVHQWMLEDNK